MSLDEWAAAFGAPRHVGNTQVGEQWVSTVWLGLDHGFGGGPSLIFETLVFPLQERMERYATKAEAEEGHARIVAELEREAAK